MAMVSASSAAASQLTCIPSAATDTNESNTPIASAWSGGTTPRGMGRIAVARHSASMSASHHMLSAPQAPAPAAMAHSVARSFSQSTGPGASRKPTAPVNTTSDMTRGLRRTRWSTTPPPGRWRDAVPFAASARNSVDANRHPVLPNSLRPLSSNVSGRSANQSRAVLRGSSVSFRAATRPGSLAADSTAIK